MAALRRIGPTSAIAGLLFAAGLLALGVELAAERHTQTGVAVERTRIAALERLLSGLKDLETGERGYVLIGRDECLEPYFSGNAAVAAEIKVLAAQRGGIPRLGPLIEAKRAIAARVIATRREQGQAAAQELITSGGDKATMARAVKPHAILLDVMMPRMDGWAVLSELKAEPDLAGIPVIMVTFVNEPVLGASLGAAELIPKPVDWERLKSIMERFRGEGGVLIVDDDDDVDARARLRHVLERNGWRVREAEDGRAALAEVVREVPQLILLDLTMPVMDGFAFLDELRNRPGCNNVPVVVLTARDLSRQERERLHGADKVLAKGETDLRELAGQVSALATPPAERNERTKVDDEAASGRGS